MGFLLLRVGLTYVEFSIIVFSHLAKKPEKSLSEAALMKQMHFELEWSLEKLQNERKRNRRSPRFLVATDDVALQWSMSARNAR